MPASPQQGMPSTTQQFVTPDNGLITPPWYRLLLSLFKLTGGGGNTTTLPVTLSNSTGTVVTAAAMNASAILRSGPNAPFTDTIDTAKNYLSARNYPVPQSTSPVVLINLTAFNWTISPVIGVTFSGNLTAGNFVVTAHSQRTLIIEIDNINNPAIQIFG